MKTEKLRQPLTVVVKIGVIFLFASGLLRYPTEIADGIRNGLLLLGENIIPSLFPFMVLSGYVRGSTATDFAANHLHKISNIFFRVNSYGLIAVIMGLLGGYPIGAKTTAEFLRDGKLSLKEAQRVMLWCVNPGPSFVITSVGTFMAGSYARGIIMYLSCVLTSLSIGFFYGILCRFAKVESQPAKTFPITDKHLFIKAVTDGSRGMLSICGWVLIFCGASSFADTVINSSALNLFIKCLSEVTLGCKTGIENNLSLPLICAILGFGGFAVIAQVTPYLEACQVKLKTFICWRIIYGAASAFYCSRLLYFFPQYSSAFACESSKINIGISYNLPVAAILILMCFVLVLEVDNHRKMC